ncbi:NupC/NupG family nucleoside CNT transporter [Candidatus Marithrix sp. Canyon 246]|uniref:NupC/NupG family nucleoside CNT transporter n=3 Tax=Candidatus Marithrix sp. Canyon 246 TaxID=1827136 RepID=UPI00084A0EA3|nr:nucleoside transporter C-terminal domain-containing protein [Candidatus Marithrix sp. Canyon 246]
MMILQSIFGILSILLIAYLFSEAKKTIVFKSILIAIAIHLILTIMFLNLPIFKDIFMMLNKLVLVLETATTAGTSFVFGYLGGGATPFEIKNENSMFILAFKALPIILIMSVISYLLYYYRILPFIVKIFSLLLEKTLKIRGAAGVSAAANAFVGMVEAPLLIKPYIKDMTRGELFSVMVAGMSTIAGSIMVLYATIIGSKIPDAMGHILTASVLNVISALIISMIMIPHNSDKKQKKITFPKIADSPMDAIIKGTSDGVKLLVNIIAMLIVLIALVNLINQIIQPLSLQYILGIIMAPLTFLIGIPVAEIMTAGSLMGTKIILNELIAYIDLSNLPKDALQEKSQIIMIYAMCGFANIGSLGIMVGGMTTMAPEKRSEIISLGIKSVFAGVLATCFTAAVVGLII